MFKNQNKLLAILLGCIVFFSMGIGRSYANGVISFGPGETNIIGSIPYTLIGKYKARFNAFKGRIILDKDLKRIQSVYLEIEAGSIHSNHPWCDKIARSRRLLFTAHYPKIIFKSEKITYNESGYLVNGVLEMHGIKKSVTFPFNVVTIYDQKSKQRIIIIKGSWAINRKDFDIVWSKLLDQGGIVVGDLFTVDWGIKTVF